MWKFFKIVTWLKFKHGTPKKQYNVTTILPSECAFTQRYNCTTKCFSTYFQQFTEWANGFWQQEDSSSQKIFLVHIILLIRIYGPKKLEVTFPFTTRFFSIGLLMTLFTSSSKSFAINPWFTSNVFFLNAIILLLLK